MKLRNIPWDDCICGISMSTTKTLERQKLDLSSIPSESYRPNAGVASVVLELRTNNVIQ